MSDDDLAVLRTAYAAWTESGPEGVRPFLHDEVEIHDPPQLPDAAVHRGMDAAMVRYREWQEALGAMRLRVKEIVPAGDEYVVIFDIHVEGPSSGVPLTGEAAHATLMVDGKARRQRAFFSAAEAFAAAGESAKPVES
jgi:ketosteroid isomerase-like protein